jgi:hypothetical protein
MSPRIHLAHGASGNADSMQPWVAALRDRGLEAATVQLPRGRAERAIPAFEQAAPRGRGLVIGGHSFGGRVASLLAADGSYAALILLSYPLHPPGRTERWEERTAHWPSIRCPVLVLSGDRDPFARIELLHDAVARLAHARLEIFSGQRHGLTAVRGAATDAIAAFLDTTLTPDGRRA